VEAKKSSHQLLNLLEYFSPGTAMLQNISTLQAVPTRKIVPVLQAILFNIE